MYGTAKEKRQLTSTKMLHTRSAAEEKYGRQLTLHLLPRVPKAPPGRSASFSVTIKLFREFGACTAESKAEINHEAPKQLPSGSISMQQPSDHRSTPRMAGFGARAWKRLLILVRGGCRQSGGGKGGSRHHEPVAELWVTTDFAVHRTNA